jgi:hypothetical protein
MLKVAVLAAAAMFAAPGVASAQELAANQPGPCQKFHPSGQVTGRDAMYVHAACVVARAGVAAPNNGPLTQEELVSILMLLSLQQQTPATHTS